MATNESAIAPKQKTISITRTFNLPLKTVWEAWAEPEQCKKWWGPKDYTCPHVSIDFKVGGKYLSCMRSNEGKEYWSTGTYLEIIPLKKIVLSDHFADSSGNVVPASDYGMPGKWPDELIITVTVEEEDGKTKLTLNHEGIPEVMHDDCVTGWQQSFDKLEKNLQ